MTGIAIIGAGVIGRIHARNVAASSDTQLRWVIDQDAGRAAALAHEYGGQVGVRIEDALRDDRVDAVIIGSSTSAHRDHLMAAIRARRPTLCEKPVADELDDARRCAEAAATAGVPVAVGFNRRYDATHLAMHGRLRAGEFGKVEMLHIVSRTNPPVPDPAAVQHNGGLLREKGSHHYDLAGWMTAAEPVEVFCAGDCLIDAGFARHGDIDTAALTVRFDSGALATFAFSRRSVAGYEEMIEVFGSEGMIESPRLRAGAANAWRKGVRVEEGLHDGWYARFAQTYVAELAQFVRLARGEPATFATMADGVRAQGVAEAAIRSLRSGKSERIERVW